MAAPSHDAARPCLKRRFLNKLEAGADAIKKGARTVTRSLRPGDHLALHHPWSFEGAGHITLLAAQSAKAHQRRNRLSMNNYPGNRLLQPSCEAELDERWLPSSDRGWTFQAIPEEDAGEDDSPLADDRTSPRPLERDTAHVGVPTQVCTTGINLTHEPQGNTLFELVGISVLYPDLVPPPLRLPSRNHPPPVVNLATKAVFSQDGPFAQPPPSPYRAPPPPTVCHATDTLLPVITTTLPTPTASREASPTCPSTYLITDIFHDDMVQAPRPSSATASASPERLPAVCEDPDLRRQPTRKGRSTEDIREAAYSTPLPLPCSPSSSSHALQHEPSVAAGPQPQSLATDERVLRQDSRPGPVTAPPSAPVAGRGARPRPLTLRKSTARADLRRVPATDRDCLPSQR